MKISEKYWKETLEPALLKDPAAVFAGAIKRKYYVCSDGRLQNVDVQLDHDHAVYMSIGTHWEVFCSIAVYNRTSVIQVYQCDSPAVLAVCRAAVSAWPAAPEEEIYNLMWS